MQFADHRAMVCVLLVAALLGSAHAYPRPQNSDPVAQIQNLAKESRGLADDTAKVANEIQGTLLATEQAVKQKEEEKNKLNDELKANQASLQDEVATKEGQDKAASAAAALQKASQEMMQQLQLLRLLQGQSCQR